MPDPLATANTCRPIRHGYCCMRAIIDQPVLAAAATATAKVASRNPVVVIYAAVRVEASDGKLALTCFDGEGTWLTNTIPADVKEPGVTVLPARKFAEIAGAMPAQPVTLLASGGDTCEVAAARSRFELRALTDDFSPAPAPTGATITIDGQALTDGLAHVDVAQSTDQSRPILTAAVMEAVNGIVRFVATDSYRLAYRATDTPTDLNEQLLLPPSAVAWITALSGDEPELALHLDGRRLHVTTATSHLAVSLIEGDYPKWESLVPTEFAFSFAVDSAAITTALKQVGLLGRGADTPVSLAFAPDAPLEMSVTAHDTGTALVAVDGEFTGERPITVKFNPHYLQQGIAAIGKGTLTVRFNDEIKPVVLQGDDDAYTYLLMPVRA